MTWLNDSPSMIIDPYTGEKIIKQKLGLPMPWCCMCGCEADSYELIKETKEEVTLLVKCHGDHDYITLRLGEIDITSGLDLAFKDYGRYTLNGRQVKVFYPKEDPNVII